MVEAKPNVGVHRTSHEVDRPKHQVGEEGQGDREHVVPDSIENQQFRALDQFSLLLVLREGSHRERMALARIIRRKRRSHTLQSDDASQRLVYSLILPHESAQTEQRALRMSTYENLIVSGLLLIENLGLLFDLV